MRVLFFTDVHIRATNPLGRVDNFYESALRKLREVRDYANENNIDYVIHGGDLFDRPDTAIKPSSEAGAVFGSFDMPVYSVIGNHDIFGYNEETIERSMLGLFIRLGIIKAIDKKGEILEKDGVRVLLFGTNYSYELDRDKNNYIISPDMVHSDPDKIINVVHGFLLDRPFIEGVPHILLGEITDTQADLTLAGHYHSGFKTQEIEGKLFANPGSLMRISRSQRELNRMPKFLVINIDKKNIDIEEIYLKSARPGREVMDEQAIIDSRYREERMMIFSDSLSCDIELDQMDLDNIVEQIAASENLEDKVRIEAKERLDRAKEYRDA